MALSRRRVEHERKPVEFTIRRFETVRMGGMARLALFLALSLLASWGTCGALGFQLTWVPKGLPGVLIFHYLIIFLIAAPLVILLIQLSSGALRLVRGRAAPRAVRVLADFVRSYYAPANISRGLAAYGVFGLTLVAYLNLKPAIPLMNSRHFDEVLWNGDWWLSGFGAVYFLIFEFNHASLTNMLDHFYFQMFNLVILTLSAFHKSHAQFWRFTATMPLAFVLSLPISILIPSLGPAFYRPELFSFTEGTKSAEIMIRLWNHYEMFRTDPVGTPVVVANGIVAMPSLHITLVFLSVFFLVRAMPHLSIVLWGILGLFFLSTVYLGWHYISDGIVGIVLGYAVLPIARRWFPEDDTARHADSQESEMGGWRFNGRFKIRLDRGAHKNDRPGIQW